MAETALNFGPDWLRALSHGSSQPSEPPSASATAAPKYQLAEFRYGREEMLALVPKEPDLPESLKEYPHLAREKFQVPLALTPVTEEEQRIWTRSVNSDAVLRQSGKGGPSLGRTGRGGSVDRGRGRGRGGFYQRGLAYEDSDDGPSTSFSRPKTIERSQSANEKDQRWDDRDRRFDRPFSGRGAGDDSLSKDSSRGSHEYWRKFEKEDESDWRTSGLRSSDKLGGRGSWRSSSDKDRRDAVNLTNRGANNNVRSPNQKGAGSHSWQEASQGHLPEWSFEEGDEPDIVGTFDSSGAFLEKKIAECSLDEIYASDDADEGSSKDSPEAKPDHLKKTSKKSPSSSSVKQKSVKSKLTVVKNEENITKMHLSQNASEPCINDPKKPLESSVDNVIKQCVIVEQCHLTNKNMDFNPSMPNVPDVAKSTKSDNIILRSSRASEASASSTSVEEDAFAHHKKATENMVAQWTEEEEQHISVISQKTPDVHPIHQENDNKWFYQDPQGEIQGPFTYPEMLEWFNAGYFTMSLMVRRGCDKKFFQLGELIKSWGCVPFMPGSSPPPVHATDIKASLPTPITQTIVPPNPVSVAAASQMPKQDDQYIALTHQLMQQQLMQQQLLLRQAQLQQLVAQFKQQDKFASLSQQQQQAMLQQFMAQQQLPRPYIGPMAEKPGIEALQPLPLPLLGLTPLHPMMKNDLSMWNIAPGTGGAWPPKVNPSQPSNMSIWDVDAEKVNSEESELEKQKRIAEEEARKMEEAHLQQERELQEKRNMEELRRKQEEDRILMELQKQEEERDRLEAQKKEEARRFEERRKLEEQQKLEEQRRMEEQKRLAEIKRQEELKHLEELKRQEEKKRFEELKLKEEQRRHDELRKQEELRKLEEKKQKEEQERKLQMEKERQLELERHRELQRQKEAEEMMQREREKQKEKEREEMEMRRIAELKMKSQGPAWGIRNTENNAQLSLDDIQRLQEEKEREEREEKMRVQMMQQQAVKLVQQNKNNLSWAKRSAETVPAVTSLAEIQQEEAERLAQLQRNQKPQAPAPVVNANANVGVWGNSSHLSKITAAPQSWSAPSAPPSGFWDDALNSTQTRKQPTKSNDSAFPALAIPTQPAAVSSNKSKNVRAKKEEDVVTKLFNSHRKPTDEFTKWCTEAISSMPSSVDVPTFVAFLKDIESPYEVYDYVKSYLGEGKEPREFAKQFLERRSKYRNQAKQSQSEDNTLWGPAPAITPNVNKITSVVSNDCDGNPSTKGKAKKKKNRMQKMDNSMLGFTVQSNPDRLNAGEIDRVEGM